MKARHAVEEPLEAWMELAGGGTRLRLVVGVAWAAWPVVVKPIFSLVVKLLPPPRLNSSNAKFGQDVAIDGGWMVVGIRHQHLNEGHGAARVFHRDLQVRGVWNHVKELSATDGAYCDEFGKQVAIDGDTVLVGAPSDLDDGWRVGSVSFFSWEGGPSGNWTPVATITPKDEPRDEALGYSAAISGDIAVVGDYLDDDNGRWTGAACVFERDVGGGTGWQQVAKLVNPTSSPRWSFGTSVAVSGDTIIVGTPDIDFGGMADIFQRNHRGPNNWGHVATLASGNWPDTYFGNSVDISGDAAEDHRFGLTVDIDGDLIVVISSGSDDGSAYFFGRDHNGPDAWGEIAKVIAPGPDDAFGTSAASSNGTVVIGASLDEQAGPEAGAAYIYTITDAFFADGFELSDTSVWSRTVP